MNDEDTMNNFIKEIYTGNDWTTQIHFEDENVGTYH